MFCMVLCVLLAGAPASAQQPPDPHAHYAQPTPDQQELNTDAVEAMIKDNYARAAALLEQSNLISELNVAYLNLGRAYQKLGKCAKARAALHKALTAPKVAKPRPEIVAKKAHAYLDELDKTCKEKAPAKADTAAKPPSGGEPAASANTPKTAKTPAPAPPTAPLPAAETPGWAWGAIAGGGLVLVGAGVTYLYSAGLNSDILGTSNFDANHVHHSLTEEQARNKMDTVDTLDTVALGAAIVGTAVVAVGVYGLVSTPEEAPPATSSLGVGPTRDGWQVQWRASF